MTGSNTYLVGSGKRRILIDTGEGAEDYPEAVAEAMRQVGCEGLQDIIVTHWHHDHLGGVPSIQGRFGPTPTHKFMPGEKEATFGGEGAVDPFQIWPKERFTELRHNQTITTEGATLRVLYTPGHANDHVVLVLEEESAMFTADNVLGVGTAVFRDLRLYLQSLTLMKAARPQRLYPGHGTSCAMRRALCVCVGRGSPQGRPGGTRSGRACEAPHWNTSHWWGAQARCWSRARSASRPTSTTA